MNPRRIAIKFFTTPDPQKPVDLEPLIPLFHRFIQQGSVEGLLIDVADYAHVPQGPGVILIGHDVDYGVDLSEGRAGLLTTRKRFSDLTLGEVLGDTLRKALIAIRAIEADASAGLRFATDSFSLSLVDRSATPNDDEAFEAVRSEIAPVLEKLFGDPGVELTRANHADSRKVLAISVAPVGLSKPAEIDAILERLGGSAVIPTLAKPAEAAGDWEIDAEALKGLRDSGADFVLVDVREPDEYEVCNLGGELIPLGSLGDRMGELDEKAHIVVHCKTGPRSSKAVAALRGAGFENVWSLKGGILAWIERVDPSLRRY